MEFAFMAAVKFLFSVSVTMSSWLLTSAQCSPLSRDPLVRMAVTLSPMVLNPDKSNFHVLSASEVFIATTTALFSSGSYAASVVPLLVPIIVYPGRIYLENCPYA